MDASSDSEQDFEAEQDKILIGELSRHAESATSSRKRRPAELLPVGQSSDDDDDDDDEDDAAVGQFQDLLKRARLQRLRKEVAEDMGDDDDTEEDEDVEAAGDEKAWAASRRYRYAAGDSDDDEGEGDDDGDGKQVETATTSRLMRLERDRLRRRLLGVGVPSDLPDVDADGALAMAAAAASTYTTTATRSRADAAASSALVRVASELPTYQRPPPGVPLERHLLADPAGGDRWPDMRRAYQLKARLEGRLKPLVGKPESALTDLQAALKWHYILLCAYLRMRANSAPGLHRHPVRRLLRRAGDALRRLGDAAATQKTARAKPKSKAMARKVEVEKAIAKKVEVEKAPTKARKVDVEKATASEAAAEADADGSGHRPIYWEMQKNLPVRLHKRRQLAQKKRKLGDSNPRVKLRDKYRRALIKRRSQVPDVRPEINRYSGELSGIRAGLVKSRKFK